MATFWETLKEPFTADRATGLQQDARRLYDQQQAAGRADIAAGYGKAGEAARRGYTEAQQPLLDAYRTGAGAVGTGADAARSAYEAARAGGVGAYGAGRSEFDTLAALGGQFGDATYMQRASMGLYGPEAAAQAKAAYESSLQPTFEAEQGINSLARLAAATKRTGGNLGRDAMTFGQNLARSQVKGWQDALGAYVNPQLAATSAAASGRSDLWKGQAGLEERTGAGIAGVEKSRGETLAELARLYGGASSGLYKGLGDVEAGLATGEVGKQQELRNLMTTLTGKSFGDESTLLAGAGKNLTNLLQEGLKLAASGGKPDWTKILSSWGGGGGGGAPVTG